MAVEDHMIDTKISSMTLATGEYKLVEDLLSPEDVAWADSCLVKDFDISDSSWSSFKDALSEIGLKSKSSVVKKFVQPAEVNNFTSDEDAGMYENLGKTVDRAGASDGQEANVSDDSSIDDENNDYLSKEPDLERFLLPSYNENSRDLGSAYLELDLLESPKGLEVEDIFKVWDLEVQLEDDELINQLNKVLAESTLPLVSNGSGASDGLTSEALDDLISGIADLSLTQSIM